MNRRDIGLKVLERHLGTPYRWGGDDPTGFDCSGLMNEVLESAGQVPRGFEATADALMRTVFGTSRRLGPQELVPGAMLFWGTPAKATHVEMVWTVVGSQPFTIGASGGGSKTTDLQAAIDSNAFVKLRPARPGWIAALDPFAGA